MNSATTEAKSAKLFQELDRKPENRKVRQREETKVFMERNAKALKRLASL